MARKKKGTKGGMPAFVPTDEQRRMVAGMVSVKISQDEMCDIIWNPRTNRPISKHVLLKHFRRELTEGAHKLRALLGKRWLELIHSTDDRVSWHAVEFGLKYICGYNENTAPQVNIATAGADNEFKISFVQPNGKTIDLLDDIDDAAFESRPRDNRPVPRQIEHNSHEHDSRRLQSLHDLYAKGEDRGAGGPQIKPSRARAVDIDPGEQRETHHRSVWDHGSGTDWMKR